MDDCRKRGGCARFPCRAFFPFRRRGRTVPHAALDLQIKAEFVRGFKGGLGWAPRMKAHMIQAIILARLKNFLPRRDVGGRITGEREIAAVVRAAEVNWPAVQDELVSVGVKISHSKSAGNFRMKSFASDGCAKVVAFGIELVDHSWKWLPIGKNSVRLVSPGPMMADCWTGLSALPSKFLGTTCDITNGAATGLPDVVTREKCNDHPLFRDRDRGAIVLGKLHRRPRNSIFPTIPFQAASSESETLCASGR